MSPSIAETIKNRRTIHQFKTDESPSTELIQVAIENATWAPNHHLTEPWHFHLIGTVTAEQICQLNAELVREKKGEKAAEIKLRRWREVPGWLLLSCDISDDELKTREDYAACCCVAQNLALCLWEKGVGLKWTTGAVCRDQRFYDMVNLDGRTQSVVGLFWYGYPLEIPMATRSPLSDCLSLLP
ncbi:MAG: nitroreductase [Planctomycetota bacterium]|jgi:nitroreductase